MASGSSVKLLMRTAPRTPCGAPTTPRHTRALPAAPPISSFPRTRESRASDGAAALDPRFRGGDDVGRAALIAAISENQAGPAAAPTASSAALARSWAFFFGADLVGVSRY